MSMESHKGPPLDVKQTIRLDIRYDGSSFLGWQRQSHPNTVQEILEEAIEKVAKEKITLYAASRLDAGVHAQNQVAIFHLCKNTLPEEAFLFGLRKYIPSSIHILRVETVDHSFFPIREAKSKVYRYWIYRSPLPSIVCENYSWRLSRKLDVISMKMATKAIIGTHDFSSFEGAGSEVQSKVREILHADWFEDGRFLLFEIQGRGFLKQMVRILVGTLVEIGWGDRKPEEMTDIMKMRSRASAGQTAPARGLYLWNIFFEDVDLNFLHQQDRSFASLY